MFVFSFTNFYQFPICFPSFSHIFQNFPTGFPDFPLFFSIFLWFSHEFQVPQVADAGSMAAMAQGPSLCGKTRIMQTLTQALTEDMAGSGKWGRNAGFESSGFSGNSSPENPKCFMIYDDSWFPANVPWNKSIDFKWGVALNHPFGGPHFGGNLQIW